MRNQIKFIVGFMILVTTIPYAMGFALREFESYFGVIISDITGIVISLGVVAIALIWWTWRMSAFRDKLENRYD